MTNLEHFYPGAELKSFRRSNSAVTHEPDSTDYCIDCMECPAFSYCGTVMCKTCIDTFETWAKLEYKETP